MLFLRGQVWWYKAPDGERFSTGSPMESEVIEFKILSSPAANRSAPHQDTCKTKGATINELLDAHLAHMRRQGRKSTKGVEQVLTKHVRLASLRDRVASTLTTADFECYPKAKEDKVKPTTINRHLSHLRSGFVTGYSDSRPGW